MSCRSGRALLVVALCGVGILSSLPAAAEDVDLSKGTQLAQAARRKKKRRHAAPSSGRLERDTREESEAGEEPEEDEAQQPQWGESATVDQDPPVPAPSLSTSADEEVMNDPELEDDTQRGQDRTWGTMMPIEDDQPLSTSASAHDPLANTGIARLELIGQQGLDMRHEYDLEDAYESRLRFDAEVDFRRSRKLRMSVGVRTDLLWALPASNDPDLTMPGGENRPPREYTALQQDRWELDILPLSAFIDTTLGDAFHLRIGEQTVSMSRMDFYSPIDILAAFDMRGQPKLDPAAGKLAQPAVRADWDISSWATLQVVYVPWFMPHLTRPNRDRYVARALGTAGPVGSASGTGSSAIDDLIDPSWQTQASQSFTRFVGPTPDFTTPQAQARLTLRGSIGELALSAGTALEKLPSVYLTPTAERYAQGDGDGLGSVGGFLSNGWPVADVAYHRYALFGLDGSTQLGPVTAAFELAFSPSRHLIAATSDGSHLPQPNVSAQIVDPDVDGDGNVRDRSIRKGVPVFQAAAHLDWLKGERFAVALEGFMVQALQLPYDRTRDWWGFIPDKGIYAGGILGMTYRPDPDAGRWRIDTSAIALVGPSLVAMLAVEYKVLEGFYLNVGAQIFEGPAPPRNAAGRVMGGQQQLALGGLFSGYDQFFLGFRYLP